MNRNRFEVVKGGLMAPPNISDISFVSAYVTDTRLMGVVGLYIHWDVALSNSASHNDFHQFFYFDAEEFGFEDYQSIYGNDRSLISRTTLALFGSLGGIDVDVTEREAIYLVQHFAKFNREHNLPLPGDSPEQYAFLLEKEVDLSPKERSAVAKKMCTDIVNPYQAIHYFLMRVFGKDFLGASYLTKGSVFTKLFDDLPACTLCQNTITEHIEGDKLTYLSESVIDCETTYMIVVSEAEVSENHQIVGFQRHSAFKISSAEASMKLRRPEFVTVYSFLLHPSQFEAECPAIGDRAMCTAHESGNLYMLLKDNNDHVKKPVFVLSNDVHGLCFVTSFGQIIAAAYSLSDIHDMEGMLRRSDLAPALRIVAKYEFKEPLLYEFVNSGFEYFDDFLDVIKDEDE